MFHFPSGLRDSPAVLLLWVVSKETSTLLLGGHSASLLIYRKTVKGLSAVWVFLSGVLVCARGVR